jgi:hypothetical protein
MRARVLTSAVVAIAVGAALFAMAADRDDGLDAWPETRERALSPAAAQPSSSAPDEAQASPAAATKRARVPAGVLARAVSRRAQDREAAGSPSHERRRGRDQGDVISVEIDWHATIAADR